MLYSYLGATGASKLTAVHELPASDISYKCNEFGKKKNDV
jgi:hypothetical protein